MGTSRIPIMFIMKLSKTLKRLSWLFFLFLAAIIFTKDVGFAKSFFRMIDEIPMGDKLGHFFLMGTMVFLVNLSLKCKKIQIGKFWVQKGLVIVAPFVFLEEFSQMFISSRQFSSGDMLADLLGLLFFSYLSQKVFENPILRSTVS